MKIKKDQIITVLLSVIAIVISVLFIVQIKKGNETASLKNMDSSPVVPYQLTSIKIRDINNNLIEGFSKNSSYNLFVFASVECQACSMLLEEIYNNEEKLIDKSIDPKFVWLTSEEFNSEEFNSIKKKVGSDVHTSVSHYVMPINEFTNIVNQLTPVPLIVIYNAYGELQYQSIGFSTDMDLSQYFGQKKVNSLS